MCYCNEGGNRNLSDDFVRLRYIYIYVGKMDRIHWADKSITFRNLVDNSTIQKPVLGRYSKFIISK